MYTITFCRVGNYNVPNIRGSFTKDFNTLDEIIKFYLKCNNKLWCPKIKEEMSKKEFGILLNKLSSQLLVE